MNSKLDLGGSNASFRWNEAFVVQKLSLVRHRPTVGLMDLLWFDSKIGKIWLCYYAFF